MSYFHALNNSGIGGGGGGGGSPSENSDFTYWFDGQPLVGFVEGNDFSYWTDGQPAVEEGA